MNKKRRAARSRPEQLLTATLHANPELLDAIAQGDQGAVGQLIEQLSNGPPTAEEHAAASEAVAATAYKEEAMPNSKKSGNGGALSAYCVKCGQLREMDEPRAMTLKNGREATRGQCPVCGTKILKLGRQLPAAK